MLPAGYSGLCLFEDLFLFLMKVFVTAYADTEGSAWEIEAAPDQLVAGEQVEMIRVEAMKLGTKLKLHQRMRPRGLLNPVGIELEDVAILLMDYGFHGQFRGGLSKGYKQSISETELKDDTYKDDGLALFRVQGSGPDNMQATQVEPSNNCPDDVSLKAAVTSSWLSVVLYFSFNDHSRLVASLALNSTTPDASAEFSYNASEMDTHFVIPYNLLCVNFIEHVRHLGLEDQVANCS
ncbi:unnamed protein product [Fraxinus pennsylvanica]|uniref:Uncharacterized protein n=1 Tax=Fraxinus pennsylvanica TaxID=56036 RepID=A0AAD1ZC12_9LAMI|nr:unnamed protein product [Fraxinus pennsylvanica]